VTKWSVLKFFWLMHQVGTNRCQKIACCLDTHARTCAHTQTHKYIRVRAYTHVKSHYLAISLIILRCPLWFTHLYYFLVLPLVLFRWQPLPLVVPKISFAPYLDCQFLAATRHITSHILSYWCSDYFVY